MSYELCIICYVTFSETLRALYMGDNDFEYLPPEIGNLKNLQIVSSTMVIIICLLNIIVIATLLSIFHRMKMPLLNRLVM